MRQWWSAALAAVLLAAPAFAQGGAGEGPPAAILRELEGTTALAAAPEVQTELRLDAAQKEKLNEFRRQRTDKIRVLLPGLRELEPEERLRSVAAFRDAGDRELFALLKPEQQTRLRQLSLQREGFHAAQRAEIATELGLSDAQKAEIARVLETERAAARPTPDAPPDPAERQRRMIAARMAAEVRLGQVLTDSQKARLAALQGPRFQFAQSPAEGNRMPRVGSLRVGDVAPDFTLSDLEGKNPTQLSGFRGKRPVLLVFGSIT